MSRASRNDASSRVMQRAQADRHPERDRLDPRRRPSVPDHHGAGCTRRGAVVAWRAPVERVEPTVAGVFG